MSSEEKTECTYLNEELLNEVINNIVGNFTKNMNHEMAYRLFMVICMENKYIAKDLMQINQSVEKIVRLSGNFNESGLFTIKDLKMKIANLPDGMPIVMDYLEDSGWISQEVLWEKVKINKKNDDLLTEEINPLIEDDGKDKYYLNYTKTVNVFDARETTDKFGKRVFYIHAHY